MLTQLALRFGSDFWSLSSSIVSGSTCDIILEDRLRRLLWSAGPGCVGSACGAGSMYLGSSVYSVWFIALIDAIMVEGW